MTAFNLSDSRLYTVLFNPKYATTPTKTGKLKNSTSNKKC